MISFLVEVRIQSSLEDITKENVEWIWSKTIYAFLKATIRCLFGVRSLHSLGLSFCYLQISRLGLGLGDCIVLKFRLITSLGLVRSIYSQMRCRTAPLTLSLNLKTSLHQVAELSSPTIFFFTKRWSFCKKKKYNIATQTSIFSFCWQKKGNTIFSLKKLSFCWHKIKWETQCSHAFASLNFKTSLHPVAAVLIY